MRPTPTGRPQVGGVLSSAHSASERVQHTLVPHDTVHPLLWGWGLSGGDSPEGHCRQSLDRSSVTPVFISLRPFAPPALPDFDATMDALTPAHRSVPEVASVVSCLSRCPILHRSLDCCVWCSPKPLFPRVVTVVMSRYPCFLCCTFRPFCLQPPLAVLMRRLGFAASSVPSIAALPLRSCPRTKRIWVSPLTSRLTTATGRIEFVSDDRSHPVLRTGRSLRVAPHPASRRRSYLRLRGTRHPPTRTFTSPMQQHHRRTCSTPSA